MEAALHKVILGRVEDLIKVWPMGYVVWHFLGVGNKILHFREGFAPPPSTHLIGILAKNFVFDYYP